MRLSRDIRIDAYRDWLSIDLGIRLDVPPRGRYHQSLAARARRRFLQRDPDDELISLDLCLEHLAPSPRDRGYVCPDADRPPERPATIFWCRPSSSSIPTSLTLVLHRLGA